MATQNPAKVKITVLKKLYHEDLVDAYLLPEKKASYPPCYRFNERGTYSLWTALKCPRGSAPGPGPTSIGRSFPLCSTRNSPIAKSPAASSHPVPMASAPSFSRWRAWRRRNAPPADRLAVARWRKAFQEGPSPSQRPLLCLMFRLFLWAGIFLSKRTGPHRHGMGPYVFGGAGRYSKTAPAPSQDAPTGIRP